MIRLMDFYFDEKTGQIEAIGEYGESINFNAYRYKPDVKPGRKAEGQDGE